jgi:hypothetical protein
MCMLLVAYLVSYPSDIGGKAVAWQMLLRPDQLGPAADGWVGARPQDPGTRLL